MGHLPPSPNFSKESEDYLLPPHTPLRGSFHNDSKTEREGNINRRKDSKVLRVFKFEVLNARIRWKIDSDQLHSSQLMKKEIYMLHICNIFVDMFHIWNAWFSYMNKNIHMI